MKALLLLALLSLVGASGAEPDFSQTGPLELMVTYRCDPADRPAFRQHLQEELFARLKSWQEEGWLEEFRVLFNWYVDQATWDAMTMLRFRSYADVARWREIERSMPGGLSAEGLALATPTFTHSADRFRVNLGSGKSNRESVFLVIPYKYLVLVDEYKKYADGYVVPQLEGWLNAGILASYRVLLNRYPTGDRWGAMLVLEYKDLDSFGKRNIVRSQVRAVLRENPEWKAWSDIKKTLRKEAEPVISEVLWPASAPGAASPVPVQEADAGEQPRPTRKFEIVDDLPHLAGVQVDLWGIRCANALHSQTVTERHVRALDSMVAHGINLIGVYLQGSNGGWPDPGAGTNGFDRHGRLKSSVAKRLEWLVREADARGMVVMVGLFSPRKDQELLGEQAVRTAIEESARFLESRNLRNVFVDIMHEYDHTRTDLEIFRDPDGAEKKARMTRWFKSVAPGIPVGVCPYVLSKSPQVYPGMDIHMIQKAMPIPPSGFVVNVETHKQDGYENDGIFPPESIEYVLEQCRLYQKEPRAVLLFHAGFIQGIGNRSGSAPHPEPGGYGAHPNDRGVRFYYEWVRANIGKWEFPKHVQVPAQSDTSDALPPTKEFTVVDGQPRLGGHPVRLWGLRCNNALVSPAVADRLVNNLDNMALHGINLIGLSLQGAGGGFPDEDTGVSAFAPDGRLVPWIPPLLERVVRAADRRGMVVCLTLMTPHRDQLLRDAAAVRRGIEEVGRFLQQRNLRNVFVNLFQEFGHPTQIDHELFQEPDGAAKKSAATGWLKSVAPWIRVGICPSHASGSPTSYPGCDIAFFHEDMPVPRSGFAINSGTRGRDLSGNEGLFNPYHLRSLQREWETYLDRPNAALLFTSPFVEDVRGKLGTGPNLEMGGSGSGVADRGVLAYYLWLGDNVGRWVFPRHVKD